MTKDIIVWNDTSLKWKIYDLEKLKEAEAILKTNPAVRDELEHLFEDDADEEMIAELTPNYLKTVDREKWLRLKAIYDEKKYKFGLMRGISSFLSLWEDEGFGKAAELFEEFLCDFFEVNFGGIFTYEDEEFVELTSINKNLFGQK